MSMLYVIRRKSDVNVNDPDVVGELFFRFSVNRHGEADSLASARIAKDLSTTSL